MKTRIFLFMSMFMGLTFASCNDDDDYTIFTQPILNEESVVTGSADVTATTATLHATVDGLGNTSAGAFVTGFKYGFSETELTQNVTADYADGAFTADVTSLTDNTTLYYQAYVTLSGRVTYTGKVSSCVTTDAKVTTSAATTVDHAGATLSGTSTGAPADATCGFVIAATGDIEAVRSGLRLPVDNGELSSFSYAGAGLAPATTYYYAAYVDLGAGVVYGDVQSFTTSAFDFDLDNDLIDLGLSVKWARFNVGARTANEAGGLYGYGDLTGVNNSIALDQYGNADIYRTASDVANHAWSGKVTLPTAADFEELFAKCSKEWAEVDGVAGYKLTGPNGNSIFLPAAGSRTINDVTGAGTAGVYATGSINPTNSQYAIAYRFGADGNNRTSTPVYEALSVRPVSTARNAVFDSALLYKTWEIDYNEGASLLFNGPVWFRGTDDSWATVMNGEPIVGDSWLWDADASNTWAFGDCTGYMTFNEDGTVVVKNQNGAETTGHYTIDAEAKTITADVDLLAPDNFVPDMVNNRKNGIKIMMLNDNQLQLGYYRDSEPATLCVNMIPQIKKYGFDVKLLCVGSDWNGTWDTVLATHSATDLDGVHTAHYDGACNGAMIVTLDVKGLRDAFPNAIVAIKEMRLDGEPIKMDASKMFYGDIENNGNFRVEVFNIYGKGANQEKVHSPFSDTYAGSDPAFTFTSSLDIDYVILTEPKFTPNLITINPDWGGSWDYNQGASFNIIADADAHLTIDNPTFDITYESDIHAAGSIMTFLQVSGFMQYFPGTRSKLDGLWLDGTEVTGWDASKVVNTNDGNDYRLELWNMYGYTAQNGCAFGTPGENGAIAGLGFSSSMRVKFTIESLFPVVEF